MTTEKVRVRWTVWRIMSAVIAAGLFAFAINCFISAAKVKRRFIEWQTARPMNAIVDLSHPGEITVPFHQTCSSAHSEVVLLRLSGKTNLSVGLLDGLKAHFEVFRRSDMSLVEKVDADSASPPSNDDFFDGGMPLFWISSFPKGDYEAKLTVMAGAPALEGVHQNLEGQYLLCGMEEMPAVIGTIFGIVTAVLGFIISAMLFDRIRRDSKARESRQGAPSDQRSSPT